MASDPTRPRLITHHDSRSWTSFWYDDGGKKRTKRFGREGDVSAREAKARFEDWSETEWKRHQHVRNPDSAAAVFTVRELRDQYLAHARTIYRKGGEETTHVQAVEYGLGALVDHHGDQPADALTNPQLAKLRDVMIFNAEGKARSLKTVNGRLHAVQQAYKWAREKGWISATTLGDVLAVSRLRRGRSAAKDPREVQPIAWSVVEATLAHCPPTLATLIRVHWLTGMRPGEVCIMRPADIEAGGKVWLYRPSVHKLQHKDKDRVIPLGPQVQKLIRPYLTRQLSGYLFSPAEAQQQRRDTRHGERKTPMSCGNRPGSNRKDEPAVTLGEHYDANSYRKAIEHACRAVERSMRETDPQAVFAAWSPNQLRHSWATRVRKDFGIEEASAGLGHSNLSTTEIYAKKSLDKAIEVALKVG